MQKYTIKTPEEIEKMRVAAQLLAQMMSEIEKACVEGATGNDLDRVSDEFCKRHKVKPAFLGYGGFPKTLCVGINDNCVHGIPNDRKFQNGDIVTADAGLIYEGFYSDMARTFYVGTPQEETKEFVEVVRQSLENAIKEAKIGNRIGAISAALRSTATAHGFSPLIEFVGHGIGKKLHEGPIIPGAYYDVDDGPIIKEGMVLAIEAIIVKGEPDVILEKDQWTTRTADGSLFALFENTVLPTKDGGEILTKL